jgi:hypothetical protein
LLDTDAYSGSELFSDLTTAPSFSLDTVDIISGELASTDVQTNSWLDSDAFAGSVYSFDLEINPPTTFNLTAYVGSAGDLSLLIPDLIASSNFTGQFSSTSLEVFYSETLFLPCWDGQSSVVTLQSNDRFQVDISEGTISELDLNIYPSIPLDVLIQTGENCSLDMLLGITFPSQSLTGEHVEFDIDYVINTGTETLCFTGETGDVDFVTTFALEAKGYSGINTFVYLGLSDSFELYHQTGETLNNLILTVPVRQTLVANGYAGQLTSIDNLSTRLSFTAIGYHGSSGSCVLFTSQPPSFGNFNFYTGQYSDCSGIIKTAEPLGTWASLAHGQWAVLNSISYEPNYVNFSGERMYVELSTIDILTPSEITTGSIISAISSMEGSKAIELAVRAHGGDTFSCGNLETLPNFFYLGVSHTLSVLFRASVMTQCDIGSTTHFDLATTACCGPPPQSNNLRLNLHRNDYLPESHSFGNNTRFTVSLSATPRFQVNFHSGEYFFPEDTTSLLSVVFETGATGDLDGFDPDLQQRLCKGYFIPNGEWVVTEMTDILPEDCYVDRLYTGERCECTLTHSRFIELLTGATGEATYCDLTVIPPMTFRAYHGQYSRATLSTTQTLWLNSARTGAGVRGEFYEIPMVAIGYSGTSSACDGLSFVYGVRFNTWGCLDNEFQYQNEAGDLIPELFTSTPIEGEPFMHDIRASCFHPGEE